LSPMAQVTAVLRKELDVGFTRAPVKYPTGLDGFEVFRQPMVLALHSDHPLARFKKINPSALKDEMFLNTLTELEVGFWGHTEAFAKAAKFEPHIVKCDEDLTTILTYVCMRNGIGVIPKSMSRINIPNVVFREIAVKPVPTSSIAFIHRRTGSSPTVISFARHMRRYALHA